MHQKECQLVRRCGKMVCLDARTKYRFGVVVVSLQWQLLMVWWCDGAMVHCGWGPFGCTIACLTPIYYHVSYIIIFCFVYIFLVPSLYEIGCNDKWLHLQSPLSNGQLLALLIAFVWRGPGVWKGPGVWFNQIPSVSS